MNPSSKLLIAAALVAGGYGLATLLGTPHPPYVLPGPRDSAAPWTAGPSVVGSVRLLPEADNIHANQQDLAPARQSTLATTGVTEARPTSGGARSPESADSLPWLAPRARLSDVQPMPPPAAGPDARSSLLPPAGLDQWRPSVPDTDALAARLDDASDTTPLAPVASASFETAEAARPPAARAWFNPPTQGHARAPALVPVVPPPAEPAAVQIHVVVDGDSLARLAARYLDDPQRGDDIYRLNRDVLPSPDLLPIGAELKIPVDHPSGAGEEESSGSGGGAFGSVLPSGLVPVRPVPPNSAATPMAQLLGPRPAG